MNLKRTERLIEAVKLIELLEKIEKSEAYLNIEKRQQNPIWKLEFKIDGRTIVKKQSDNLGEMVSEALDIVNGDKKNRTITCENIKENTGRKWK